MTDVVVLGWDGLDLELIEEFGLGEEFGTHRDRIDTHINPALGEPHTRELWPSMITGLGPDEHGIVAATVGNRVLPDGLLTSVGGQLLEAGFGPTAKPRQYYQERSIPTVFDDVGGRAISIPNYETPADRRLGVDASRQALWEALGADRTGQYKRPSVDVCDAYDLLGRELGQRVGLTRVALHVDEPLIWTWFGLLDSVGHMGPALAEGAIEHWYKQAARVTQQLREAAGDETTVLAVSDHGIQNGTHTHYATVCCDEPQPVHQIDHVFDVADWVRRQHYSQAGAGVRLDDDGREDVRTELTAMGYIQ